MLLKIPCSILVFASVLSLVSCGRQNVSLVELAKCKQYQCFGYGYKTHYFVEDLHHMRNETDLLHTRIAILAGKDAHILLSETNNPDTSDNVVEIVLGAGSNTYCEIRKRMGFGSIKSRRVLDILSYVDPMAMVLRITKSGTISIYYEGETEPLISGEYGNFSFSLHFIAFSCWGRSTCKFFFDCPNSLYDQLTETNTTVDPLTALSNHLFEDSYTHSAPLGLKSVELGMDIVNVRFDEMKGVLKTVGKFSYRWADPKMQWDPEDYDNIKEFPMDYYDHAIWSPIIRFPDGVGIRNEDNAEFPLKTTVYHDGTIRARSRQFAVDTFCPVDNFLKLWPHDKVVCQLNLSLANAGDLVGLEQGKDHITLIHQSENSQWRIVWVELSVLEGKITYSISMQRNESFLDSLFGRPLTFALVMLMCSVFVRQSMYRMIVVLIAAIVLITTLVTLTKYVPRLYTPLIVHYYCVALLLMLLALVAHIICQHFEKYPPKSKPPQWLLAAYKNRVVNYFFCILPDSTEYNNLSKMADSWAIVSWIVDRILLICVTSFMIIIAIIGY